MDAAKLRREGRVRGTALRKSGKRALTLRDPLII